MAQCSLTERNVRLFWRFSKGDLFDVKPNWAYPPQESKEVVWFQLFVTSPFFRDGWTTVDTSRIIYMNIDVYHSFVWIEKCPCSQCRSEDHYAKTKTNPAANLFTIDKKIFLLHFINSLFSGQVESRGDESPNHGSPHQVIVRKILRFVFQVVKMDETQISQCQNVMIF